MQIAVTRTARSLRTADYVCFVQMMEATAQEIHEEHHYPENASMEVPNAVQHDGMNEMEGLPLSHAVREVRSELPPLAA